MATIDEIRDNRIKKLNKLKIQGINPFPMEVKRTHTIFEVLDKFSELSKQEEEIYLVGRIRSQRGHGKASFLNIEDGTGSIQGLIRADGVGSSRYEFYNEIFDIGDFIQVKGVLFVTQRGEKTINISDFKIISKGLLPLPEKWHGLKDEEERFRKRYLDIIFNPEVKSMIKKRSIFWNSIRNFLLERDFIEVETPVLETIAGGADAEPFITHHKVLDIDLYLRISTGELWQKKLMIAGFEKTFEIGRQFRNEGMSNEHLQDYTQMEFYWAYADYKKGMKLVEEMYRYIAQETFGTLKFKIKGFDVDLSKKWERYDYRSIISSKTGLNINEASLGEIEKTLNKLEVEYDKKRFNRTRAIDSLWKYCRKSIGGPGFLINQPVEISPLAKRIEGHPEIAARFQVILAGSEIGNGYSELNDPIDQAERFKEQQALRDAGDVEAQMFDHDFVEALEYGMPPTCGFGLSERLFSFLMDKPIRECQIFPLMKPKND
ncbi:MAG: Lysine--tRNA ligase [Parcubacteria group bacterium ADurb.Bin247]|nr:MAG: Lysine--tRNA ligase [Parcubacteria group bacterium ADurb.Bin247]